MQPPDSNRFERVPSAVSHRKNAVGLIAALHQALLRVARLLNARASAAALAAEEAERVLNDVRRTMRKQEGRQTLHEFDPAWSNRAALTRGDQVLREVARRAPIESMDWVGVSGRRSTVAINTTELTVAKRLARILRILHAQPAGADGMSGFVSYVALLKEVSKEEEREVRMHSLSQSLTLLANELEAHGLNRYWVERDPLGRRVRLLVRRSPSLSDQASTVVRGDGHQRP